MIAEWNAKKLNKINKKLGEMTKAIVEASEIQKSVVRNTFSRKLQNTTMELDLDNFETTFRFLSCF